MLPSKKELLCLKDDRYSEICREFDAKGIGIFNADIQSETQPEDITEDRIENATAE